MKELNITEEEKFLFLMWGFQNLFFNKAKKSSGVLKMYYLSQYADKSSM